MKKFLTFLLFTIAVSNSSLVVLSEDIEGLLLPKPPMYRIGTSSDLEKEYNVVDLEQKSVKTDKNHYKNYTYSDSSLKDISKEISKTLNAEKSEMLGDIQILWQGAATKSETIKFALYKLSNPDADKPDESIIKKIVRPLAGFSSVAGAGFMNPIVATTALMGGTFADSLTRTDKDLNYKYTKLNDADMIMLIRKVDELQKNVVNQYYDYISAYESLKISDKTLKNRYEHFNSAKELDDKTLMVADSYYRVALDKRTQLQFDFLSKRASLEQLVGPDALGEFEEKLKEREKSEK